MSNLIKRTVPLILVLAICFSLLVFPASASSVDDRQMIEALDYYTGDTYFFPNSTSFFFDIEKPSTSSIFYMELLIRTDYEDLSVNFCSSANPMTVYKVSDKVYRCVWSGVYAQSLFRFLLYGSNSATFVNVLSARYSCYSLSGTSLTVDYSGNCNYNFEGSFSGSQVNFPAQIVTTPAGDYTTKGYDYLLYLYPRDWRSYDFLTLHFMLEVESINNIFAYVGDTSVPVTTSYLNSPDASGNVRHYFMTDLDLTSVDRNTSKELVLIISGTYLGSSDFSSFGYLHCAEGFFVNNIDDTNISWIKRFFNTITSNHNSLMDKLDEIFGVDDDSANAAQQTQEEINVSVNNQLVGAVENWNSNIEVVQTGYDSAVTKATPALSWLASLADRIFTNMGWFGNIYFLVGLISVIMLVLSKSGLARSVGRIRRSD